MSSFGYESLISEGTRKTDGSVTYRIIFLSGYKKTQNNCSGMSGDNRPFWHNSDKKTEGRQVPPGLW